MDIINMSLNEINNIDDEDKRQVLLDAYNEYFTDHIRQGINSSIINSYYGKSIYYIEQRIYDEIEQNKIHYYRNSRIVTARAVKLCGFCGDKINRGQNYYKYHPFVEKDNNELLVLKCNNIPICMSCSSYIPISYEDLITVQQNLDIYQSLRNEDHLMDNRDFYNINYDALQENVGEHLSFKTLRKARKK